MLHATYGDGLVQKQGCHLANCCEKLQIFLNLLESTRIFMNLLKCAVFKKRGADGPMAGRKDKASYGVAFRMRCKFN